MGRRVRGQIQPDGTSLIIQDELLPGGRLACDECGEPATVFLVPKREMEFVMRDLRMKACEKCGVVLKQLKSFEETTERNYRELEDWPMTN